VGRALATAPSAARRAEVLTDRHLWRLDPPGEALAAIAEVEPVDPALAALLTSQLVYWHRHFGRGEPDAYGEHDPVDGFAMAAEDRRLAGWATLWHAVATEKLRGDAVAAGVGYPRARRVATESGDRLLESYAVRHQGFQLLGADRPAGIGLLRRSLQLRAACGARPDVAAAQVAVAEALGGGAEAGELRGIAGTTAVELGLTWLFPADGTS